MLTRNLIALLMLAFAVAAIAGPSGMIVDSSDLAKGARLVVRYDDGDKSFENDRESLESIRAVLNYLSGFLDCARLTEFMAKAMKVSSPFLLPEKLNTVQLIRVVDKYIADHPEEMNDSPGQIVWNALITGFPNKDFKPPDIKP